jgi:hypothetical protein
MRYMFLFAFALLIIVIGCDRQNTAITTSKKNQAMKYTLDICGDKKIENPTGEEIRQAVLGLDTKKGEAFLILGSTDMTYIQTSADPEAVFDLEYQEVDSKHHYRAKRDFSAEEVVKALVSYSSGADDWKKVSEWELIQWQ